MTPSEFPTKIQKPYSDGSAPEIVVMMEVAPVKEGENGEGV
jgi:hypothetical protein